MNVALTTVSTGSSSRTVYVSPGLWRGRTVQVGNAEWPCDVPGHDLMEVDNYGTPTGFLMCRTCCGTVWVGDDI